MTTIIASSYARFSTLEQERGDSERRQMDMARAYVAEHPGVVLDESIGVDRGKSAFTGKNVSDGVLGEFIERIEAGEIPKGSWLLVESPDRVSRQPFSECWPTYQRILFGGIEIHFISVRRVLRPNHSFADLIQVGIDIDRANSDSVLKSTRVGTKWAKKRKEADGQSAMSARVPAWLEAKKGQPIQIRHDRAAIVLKMYEWAAKGIGQYAITDKLVAAGIKPWGPKVKGRAPKWTPGYVGDILRSRAVIGEYQPHTKKMVLKLSRGKKDGKPRLVKARVPDGPPIKDYYPAVVPVALWQKVQDARRLFAQAKFGEYLHSGKDKYSTRNLFRKLVFDATNNTSMVYRQYKKGEINYACLVTTHRETYRQNKIRYDLFEKAVLTYLSKADWEAIRDSGESSGSRLLADQIEALAKEIDDNNVVLSRYEEILDDPKNKDSSRIKDKYTLAVAKGEALLARRVQLEDKLNASRTGSEALSEYHGFITMITSKEQEESRTRLRLEIAKRITKIDLSFGPNLLGAALINLPEKPFAIATIHFRNGVFKLIVFPTPDKGVVLNPATPHRRNN
jgi:hypothetical protein